ncbi:hypothetical protein [Candidatus Halobonum tyrrellensis]|uniref:Uncharacterized protein n=1 Tax=Candidatus Halobonum tyrrellensis G22 TaxID=1324957 RepID=V4HJ68_9EURY|nr:hypothetical protein [Candidatus Halobonum tyrrellensis]ESP87969.1 hypothetical protein K933_11651 [Candidatus Halobonum tyrrellensis G22]
MDRRDLSLGGFTVFGVVQVGLALPSFLADPGLSEGVGLLAGVLVAGLFGTYLVRGDDVNGLARRPLFVAVGVATGALSVGVAALALVG